jgi:transposase
MGAASSPQNFDALHARIVELEKQLAARDEQLVQRNELIAQRDVQIADKDGVIQELAEKVELLKAWYFAKRSEQQAKPAREETQYRLFDEAEFAAEEEPEQEPATVQVPAHSRAKRGRKPISPIYPREEIVHDIPEDEKTCGCGCELTRIGEVVSEKLDIIPQKIRVLRHIRPKYACRSCEGTEDDGPTVKIAPAPPQLIKQGIVTPGLLAYILVNKFCDGMPFYRQNKMFERLGVDISRSTMSSWALQAAEKCEPLIKLCLAKLREGDILNMDETPVQVLKEPGRKNTAKSFMWVARGGPDGKPVVLFRYDPSRAGAVAVEIVGDFKGFLQTDGYIGYKALGETESITHVGCLAHARRKFMEVLKAGSKKKKGTASTVVDLIGKLYHLESQAKKANFSPEALMAMREEKVKPILAKIKKLLEESVDAVPPKSLLGKAVSYSLGQWLRIEAYLQDPRLTPDNNIAENAIRPFAVGRKNWLFSGSPRGARASAALYSLIETAKANGLNPYEYLLVVFEQIPLVKSESDLEELLPWALLSKNASA